MKISLVKKGNFHSSICVQESFTNAFKNIQTLFTKKIYTPLFGSSLDRFMRSKQIKISVHFLRI